LVRRCEERTARGTVLLDGVPTARKNLPGDRADPVHPGEQHRGHLAIRDALVPGRHRVASQNREAILEQQRANLVARHGARRRE
jgi:hypothetical protein